MDFIKPLCEMSSRTAGLIFLVSIASVLPAPADAQTTTRVSYHHDANQHLRQISYPAFNGQPAETLGFVYDQQAGGNFGRGRLTSVSDGSGQTTFRYDIHGRVIGKAQTVGNGTPRTLTTS